MSPLSYVPASRAVFAAALAALVALAAVAPSTAQAQECRRTCRVDETRDANGCCVSASSGAAAQPLQRRCPGGSTWNDRARACIGRLTCPAGSHSEGGRCVADVIACPTGTRMEEGRCVADITCPAGTRLEGNGCVTDVQCPPGTRYEGGSCVSSDVTCPPGTTRQGERCVGAPVCPDGATFVEGRGCTVEVTCPAGTHSERGACVPDVSCLEGQQFVPGRGCVNACERYANAEWSAERRACVCSSGFALINGTCEVQRGCAPGTHSEEGQCVPDVVCPYGFRFVRGTGCVDPQVEAERIRDEARERAERERLRVTRWGNGPAVQLWGGFGGGYLAQFNALRALHRFNTVGDPLYADQRAQWTGLSASAGAAFVYRDFIVQLAYTHLQGGSLVEEPSTRAAQGGRNEFVGNWTVNANALHLLMIDVGLQGVGPIHAWRFFVGGGVDLGGGATVPTLDMAPMGSSSYVSNGGFIEMGYRSQFRVYAGFFVGIEARALGMFSPSNLGGTYCLARATMPTGMTMEVEPACTLSPLQPRGSDAFKELGIGFGGIGQLLLGYSIF